MDVNIVRYCSSGLTDPIAIIGFPSVGLVSTIIANYYVSQMEMPVVAGMSGSGMPPYCYISGGSAYPPVRIHAHKGGSKGRDVLVCLSEYSPKPEDCYDVTMALVDYLKGEGCREVICIEGVPRFTDEDQMVICGSGHNSQRLMNKSKLAVMSSGMVRGTTGTLLYEAIPAGIDVVAIMSPAMQNVPDPAAAAELIVPLSRLVRGLKISDKPLQAEAEEIKKRIEQSQPSKDTEYPFYG
ncbi:MAG: proteasome assembly chaperone family protein [Candidatus Methanomethylophilaceae archaeon]|nr:proteasome assembly chaperone family protein [Candidatus Methanomethylophilaceae archaeon]